MNHVSAEKNCTTFQAHNSIALSMTPKAIIPFTITQNWKGQAEDLKLRFVTLTDADLEFEPGKDEDVLTRIGKRLIMNRAAVIEIIKQGRMPKNL